jgi:tetratricopeptide (TPR) repeat protein
MNDLRRMQTSIGLENHAEALIQTTKRQLVAINNKGVALYKQGKFQEAMALFEQATQAMPDNKTIILNFLKILVHDLKSNSITSEKVIRSGFCKWKWRSSVLQRLERCKLDGKHSKPT